MQKRALQVRFVKDSLVTENIADAKDDFDDKTATVVTSMKSIMRQGALLAAGLMVLDAARRIAVARATK
jgi:hypothetical protein